MFKFCETSHPKTQRYCLFGSMIVSEHLSANVGIDQTSRQLN